MRLVSRINRKLKEIYYEIDAIVSFRNQKKIKKDLNKIKVVFMVQYIPGWNKTQPVYDRIIDDEAFEVMILCIPDKIKDNVLLSNINETYVYMISQGYKNVIDAFHKDNTWFDLKKYNPDFVFFPRPYNSFLPCVYLPREVNRYAKTCLIMYGIELTKDIMSVTHNRQFFRNISLYFCDNNYIKQYYDKRFFIKHRFGYQKSVMSGPVALESMINGCKKQSDIWNFSDSKFRVMWTPRWTTDKKLGGSNFFTHKDFMISYARKHSDVAMLFRPHPLALDNFIDTGEMTKSEVDEFREICCITPNISLDESKEYIATVWNSSVSVTDISAFFPEYFVTGKPVIFCISNMILELQDFALRLLEGCYIAHTSEDVEKYLDMLRKGEDPLKDKRKEIIEEVFGNDIGNISQKIVDTLKEEKHESIKVNYI